MKIAALTIGPIYKTLLRAENTRSLWGASMLFSYVMGKIISKLDKTQILLPYFDEEHLKQKTPDHISTGLVTDRLFIQYEDNENIDLSKIIGEAIADFDNEIESHNPVFWKSYIRFYFLVTEVPNAPKNFKGENVNKIGYVSDFLNTFELQDLPINLNFKTLDDYLDRITSRKPYKQFFPEQKKGFDSIFEIAVRELTFGIEKNEELYENFRNNIYRDRTMKKLKKDTDLMKFMKRDFKEGFRGHHKYICIVHADGDGIGSLITKNNLTDVGNLSKAMFEFGIKAQALINDYGAMPIIMGGDDLLIFAPFSNINSGVKNCTNVFELIDALDKLFKTSIKKIEEFKNDKNISLSFGLSATYYKYPMQDAIELSKDLLNNVAKRSVYEISGSVKIKNNLSFELKLHSGSGFGSLFHLDNERRVPFDTLCKWLNDYCVIDEKNAEGENNTFFTSVIHKIIADRELMKLMLTDNNFRIKLQNYFTNNFDEDIHLVNKEFFANLVELFAVIKSSKELSPQKDKKDAVLYEVLEEVDAILRLVKFINQTDDHE